MDTDTPQTETPVVETPAAETPAAEQTIPYSRFKTVNDELKTLKQQLAAATQQQAEKQQAAQTVAERLQALESDLASERAATLRLKVASAKGLPSELLDRLRGATEEELSADADALLAFVKPKSGPGVPLPGQSARKLDIGSMTPAQIREARAKGQL